MLGSKKQWNCRHPGILFSTRRFPDKAILVDVDIQSHNARSLRLTAAIAREVCLRTDRGASGLLDSVVQIVSKELGLSHTGLVASREGRWQFLAVTGAAQLPPDDLLASSAAEETLQANSNWVVAPLTLARRSAYLMSLQSSTPFSELQIEAIHQIVAAVGPVVLMAIRLANLSDDSEQAKSSSDLDAAASVNGAQMRGTQTGGIDWIGSSAPMHKLRATIERVASTDLPVLILGENGSGKEVASRLIHNLSARHDKPFLAVNCAALSQSLLESELFGHEAGAFTDAKEARAGKFELAADGTLFLDEIGELNLAGQSKLLRAIEEKVIVRVGGWEPITTNARIIAATNRDVPTMVRDKSFREDLFYRLNTVMLDVPSLRDRPEDILPLATHFLERFSRQSGREMTLTKSAEKQLIAHRWPGNVRELRNMMERLTFLVDANELDGPDVVRVLQRSALPDDSHASAETLADATRGFQVQHIEHQIGAARGNMTEAAKRLGLQRSNLYRKMRQLGMSNNGSEED